MLTLAFGMMVFSLLWNAREITGGDDGLVGIMREPVALFGFFSLPIGKDAQYYFLVLALFSSAPGSSIAFEFLLLDWPWPGSGKTPIGVNLPAVGKELSSGGFCHQRGLCRFGRCPGDPAGKQCPSLHGPLEPFGRTDPGQPVGRITDFSGPLVGSVFFVAMREMIQRFTENWMLWFGVVLLIIIMGFRGGVVGVFKVLTSRSGQKGKHGRGDPGNQESYPIFSA